MLQLDSDYKNKVLEALLEARSKFSGNQKAFSKQFDINDSVFSTLSKHGYSDGLLPDGKWLEIGRALDVFPHKRKWNIARTDVFNEIERDVLHCKEMSKSRIFVDNCGIGKTYTAKYLSRNIENCFYLDASQAKTRRRLVKALARTIGVSDAGQYDDIKENIKYYLHILPKPVIIIDEAGDLDYSAFLDLKEFWNGTEGVCGWYLMGASGLRGKINRGIAHEKVGYDEMFSRLTDKYSKVVPLEADSKKRFYKKLITEVLTVNCEHKELINEIVNKCMQIEGNRIGGLRRAESLLAIRLSEYE